MFDAGVNGLRFFFGAYLVVTTGGNMLPVMNSYVSSTSRPIQHIGGAVDLYSPNSDTPVNYIQTGSPQPSGFAMNIGVSRS
jgi:hypothetical protein